MCGIVGYIVTRPEEAKNAKKKMASLLMYSTGRGTDASGIAFIHDEAIVCVKKGVSAHKLIASDAYKKALKKYSPNIMIGHTRAMTQGDEKDNNNNHPLVSGAMALVHNGVISNEDEVFKDFKLQRTGEVDSEVIVRLIDHFKRTKSDITRVAIQNACKEVRGGLAIAVINAKNDRELHLVSSGNPVVIAYQKSTGTIFFASEKTILQNALFTVDAYHNFFYEDTNKDDFIFRELETDEAVRFTAEKSSRYKVERYVYSYETVHKGEHWDALRFEWMKNKPKKTEQTSLLTEGKKKIGKNRTYLTGYNVLEPIKKPSQFCVDDLLERVMLLERVPVFKRTTNEDNEIKRITDTLNNRMKSKEYATDYDPKEPMTHPDYYTLDDIEERVHALEELMENATHTPQEQAEYEELYTYYMTRADCEDEDDKKKGEDALADEIEKKYVAQADATPKEPTTADMANIVDAEDSAFDETHKRNVPHYEEY